jgi:hypothetical protein
MAVRDETECRIEPARDSDTPVILRMIKALVDREHLAHEFALTELKIRQALFATPPAAEAALGYEGGLTCARRRRNGPGARRQRRGERGVEEVQ